MKQSHKDAISKGMIKYWDRRHRKESRETYFVSSYDFVAPPIPLFPVGSSVREVLIYRLKKLNIKVKQNT